MASDRVIQTDETLPILKALPLAAQHLMAMFGATVLVPILTGLDPGVGLVGAKGAESVGHSGISVGYGLRGRLRRP